MSLDLAMSAFNASAGNFKDDTKRIFNNRFAHVKQLLSDIGCSDDNTWISPSYLTEPTTDSIACAISQKELKTSDGKDTGYTLVPIAIRGANYDKEWVSNVTVGAGTGEAEGFASAANTVTKAVTAYIRDYNLQSKIDAGKVKFWVVGYSRAGATANLTSKRLVDAYSKIGKDGSFNQIYGYDFEAPQGGVTSAEVSSMNYSCIHNLINKTDVVPKVAPTVMGFKRYGTDVYMPQYSVGTDNYEAQKADMLNQLTAVNPSITFDDYFHLATVNYLGSTILAFYAYDQIGEVDDPTGTKAEAWLDTFVDNFVSWALEDNSRGVAGTGTLRQRYAANTIWGTETFQTALQNIVGLVYSKPPETAKNIKDSASSIMDKLSTLQLRDIYDNVIGDWYTLPDEGYYNTDGAYVSGKKDYVDFLGNKLVYEKPGLDQYLKEGEITDLSKDWKVLLDVLFTFIDEDYSKNNQQLLGTLAYNSSTIMESHYPEINLAWLRSLDNFYKNDTKPVQIDDREITPAVPTSSNNLLSDTYSGNQTLKLTSTAGSAIYYTVSINDGTATDVQLYGTGIPLTVVNNANTTYKITAYSQAYWKTRESGSDLISNIGKAMSGSVTFNYTITVPPVLTVNAYNTDKTAVEDTKNSYSAGTKVTINANVPDSEVFNGWTITSGTSGSFADASAASTTFTMPAWAVTVKANYKDRISAISMDITAPTAGADLATKTANLKYGNDGQTDVPVTWSAGTTAIGSTAAYNTEYTATVVLTGDQFLSSTTATVNGGNAAVTRNAADGSLTITYTFPAAKANLESITNPANISVPYGSTTEGIQAKLPATVELKTADGSSVYQKVTWAAITEAKTQTVTGSVTLPDTITNTNSVALNNIQIHVTVEEATKAAAPVSDVTPGTYTSAQTITLSAAGTIHYTTDGTTPSESSTTYSDPITLDKTTTIKAIAVETGKDSVSDVSTFTYTINIPKVYTVTIKGNELNYSSAKTFDDQTFTYTEGTTAVISAPAVANEYFKYWTVTGSDTQLTDSTYSFAVTGNVTLTANYIPAVNTISLRLDAPAAGRGLDTTLNRCYVKISNEYYIDPAAFDITWTPTETANVAGYATAYTATIKLKSGLGSIALVDASGNPLGQSINAKFAFSAQPAVTVNGSNATLLRSSSGDSITYTFPATDPARLISITQPQNIDLAYGKNPSDNLPSTVGITVADGSVTSANVTWTSFDSYSSTTLEPQAITYIGIVSLNGTSITDPDNVILSNPVKLVLYIAGADKVKTPTATPESSSFSGKQTVALSSATSGATIYYTTDGSTPTTSSSSYSGPFSISTTSTLRVMAAKAGMQNSSTASYQYTLQAAGSDNTGNTSSGGGSTAVTVPATSSAGSAQVAAEVKNTTATVSPTDEQIKTVASTTKDTGTVKVDVTSLKVDTAVFPAKLVTASENAMDIKGITLALPAGSVSLDKTALDTVSKSVSESGKDVTVSVKAIDETALTDTQKTALGSAANDATVVSVSMLVGDTKVTAFGGGSATVTIPYTLKSGETAETITVWYLADDGTITPMHGKYDTKTKTVSFTTTHFSDYAVVSFPFTDVSEDAWYYGDVAYVFTHGLFNGTDAASFSPKMTMSRAMLVTVLWRLEGKPAADYAMRFEDVGSGLYYTEAVRWAASNKIVTGYSNTRFEPEGTVTREQIAAILYRYAQFKGIDVSIGEDTNILSYDDAQDVSQYAIPAIQWACGAQLINGSDNKLLPHDGAQRCQVAAILARFCRNVSK